MVDIMLVSDIIQFIYKVPTASLMILSVYVIIKEIRRKNVQFKKQFYTLVLCKLSNDVCFIITYYALFKIPRLGYFKTFFEKNDWIAALYVVLAVLQITFMFLITFLVSINRYVAVRYPTKYQRYFSKSNKVTILFFFIILSTLIGLGTIPFKPKYRTFDLVGLFIPYFTLKEVSYYQIFYTIFLYGTLLIATCIFNVMAILELKKHKQIAGYLNKKRIYIIYSIFIFITLSIVEAFFIIRIIATQYKINSLRYIIHFFIVIGFDLTSIGDYYFLIFTRIELRNKMRNIFRCYKKSTSKVDVKIIYPRNPLSKTRRYFKTFFEKNDWIAALYVVLAVLQITFMFLITFLVSINRYVAVRYPTKYQRYFSKSNKVTILFFFIILSTLIGLGTIPFKPKYRTFDLVGLFIPYFTLKEVSYYQIFYTIFLYGTLLIATCIFNVMAILELKKHKQIAGYLNKKRIYIIYSIFIFITLSIVETFFVIRIMAIQYKINSIIYIVDIITVIGFDLTSIGDFYFLIFTRIELRNKMRNTFRCYKKSTSKVNVKIIYQRNPRS
uniref:Serpentine receptor class gamma n=1 Tax=Strongyloides venezuelensis TaxID=75913 RepID=A0A0K0G5B0_STRVS